MGGGSVLVQVARDFPNAKLWVNDKDITIYSFWHLLELNKKKHFEDLYRLINQKPTIELFNRMKKDGLPRDLVGRAYQAIFFNRCCFSGIASSGPLGGYEQKSKYKIDCRYNASRIIKEIEELRILFKGRLFVHNMDAAEYVANAFYPAAMYLDPPYFVKGKDLYPVYMRIEEHGALADVLRERKDWLLSYDMCPEIDTLYSWANRMPLNARYSIRDKKVSWANKKEYLITPK